MQREAQTHSFDWRRLVWIAALVAASVGFSLGFACAVPLAAFAAIAALTMHRGVALLLVLAVVLANQCVGLTALHYPFGPDTLAWAAAFALVGVLAVLAAESAYGSTALAHPIVAYAAAFLAAFAAYEGGFFLITILSSSGLEPYAAPVVLRIFAINAAAFLGLLMAARIAAAIGLLGGRASLGMHQRTA
ncbi:MAG TPA: hypothetical protein VKA03_05010 [Methylovirgula sp.]|nr:hypothetical protein [Methylovirgula sp.]